MKHCLDEATYELAESEGQRERALGSCNPMYLLPLFFIDTSLICCESILHSRRFSYSARAPSICFPEYFMKHLVSTLGIIIILVLVLAAVFGVPEKPLLAIRGYATTYSGAFERMATRDWMGREKSRITGHRTMMAPDTLNHNYKKSRGFGTRLTRSKTLFLNHWPWRRQSTRRSCRRCGLLRKLQEPTKSHGPTIMRRLSPLTETSQQVV